MSNEEFQKLVLQGLHSINGRLDKIEQRLDTLEQRMDTLEQRMDTLEQRMDTLEQRLDTLEQRFNTMEQRFNTMEQRFDTMEQRFDTMDQRVGNLEKELREGFKRLEARQDEIYKVVTAVEYSNQIGRSELDNHDIRISKLEGKFFKVAKAFNEELEENKASNL